MRNRKRKGCINRQEGSCDFCPYRTLADLRPGDSATVAKLLGQGPVKRRIMDMGITKGVPVHLVKCAPLGDPIELKVRGYKLSLRLEDARKIQVLE